MSATATDIRAYGASKAMSLLIAAGGSRRDDREKACQPCLRPQGAAHLLHLCSEAVRQKSATIEIADSLTAFVRSIGFPIAAASAARSRRSKTSSTPWPPARCGIGSLGAQPRRPRSTAPIENGSLVPANPDQRIALAEPSHVQQEMYETLGGMPAGQHHVVRRLPVRHANSIAVLASLRFNNFVSQSTCQLAGISKISSAKALIRSKAFREHFSDDIRRFQEVLSKSSQCGLTKLD